MEKGTEGECLCPQLQTQPSMWHRDGAGVLLFRAAQRKDKSSDRKYLHKGMGGKSQNLERVSELGALCAEMEKH